MKISSKRYVIRKYRVRPNMSSGSLGILKRILKRETSVIMDEFLVDTIYRETEYLRDGTLLREVETVMDSQWMNFDMLKWVDTNLKAEALMFKELHGAT